MAEGQTPNVAHTGAALHFAGSISKLLTDGKTVVLSDNLQDGEIRLGDAPGAAPVGFGENLSAGDETYHWPS